MYTCCVCCHGYISDVKVEKSGVCVHNAVYVAMATDQLYQWNDLEFVCTQ